jgi:A/G-specific adenine glycosylase
MNNSRKSKNVFNFSSILLRWNKGKNKRAMPWKGEKNPYKIWLSEIILQQTRVEQGLKYYERFIKFFPDVYTLANAPDQQVYKLWEGLGYYTRCRNLIETAKYVSGNLNGHFPNHYDDIKKLKGIGPYTAAAIASFAFNEPLAVVDGNVFRVLARVFFIDKPIDSNEGKMFFNQLAAELLDKRSPGVYNQAIMDFGALVCKPVPNCLQCPFNKYCKAFRHDKVSSFPVKGKKNAVRKRWFNYLVLEHNGKFALRQRIEKDIWYHLFEFILVESSSKTSEKEILKEIKQKKVVDKNGFEIKVFPQVFRQQLSHQLIQGRFMKIKFLQKPKLPDDVFWVKKIDISKYAFPQFINQFLKTEMKGFKDAV